jgi:hypothetical protein
MLGSNRKLKINRKLRATKTQHIRGRIESNSYLEKGDRFLLSNKPDRRFAIWVIFKVKLDCRKCDHRDT